jgi:hypothetical protein
MSVARIYSVSLALLAAGVAAAAPQGAPLLVEAAENGDRVAVSRLLDQGAAVDTRAVDGTTALHWAARSDRLDTVELLLQSGADANAADRYGVTPLYLAAERPILALCEDGEMAECIRANHIGVAVTANDQAAIEASLVELLSTSPDDWAPPARELFDGRLRAAEMARILGGDLPPSGVPTCAA